MKHNNGSMQQLEYMFAGFYEERLEIYEGLITKGLDKKSPFNKEWEKDLSNLKESLDTIRIFINPDNDDD
jgi:hypothetical protein